MWEVGHRRSGWSTPPYTSWAVYGTSPHLRPRGRSSVLQGAFGKVCTLESTFRAFHLESVNLAASQMHPGGPASQDRLVTHLGGRPQGLQGLGSVNEDTRGYF